MPSAELTPTTFRFTVEYDGTDFYGWQRQSGHRTVQGVLEAACSRLAGEPVVVRGAGRTDAGTHALGQVAAATFAWKHDPARFAAAMNGLLPADVAVTRAAPAPAGFNPRADAVARWYRYVWLLRASRAPLWRRHASWSNRTLKIGAMRRAARVFRGRHDFTAFTTKAAAAQGAERRLDRVVLARRGSLLTLDVEGDGFLQHMVRLMAGALLRVGEGSLDAAAVRAALRTRKGPVAPPAPAFGLTLVWVGYPGDRRPAPVWPAGLTR